eukprot:TRINITY_DN15172_c0_g1_i4.p1 TRINITY_DN15172_c0_g1~~TRINITY_DN15172_c0_g1_i4.p1  ORF type:complete len:714 (+),score=106.69 TRINITY_DN15172_c0_g1_i4:273-2144(+)
MPPSVTARPLPSAPPSTSPTNNPLTTSPSVGPTPGGRIERHPSSRSEFPADAILSGELAVVIVQVKGDRLDLDEQRQLLCGAYGDDSAIVWLSGGGPAAAAACSVRAIDGTQVEVQFSAAKGLIPARRTIIRISLAPAAVATKRELDGGVNITLLPVEQPASTVWNAAVPVLPGISALAVRLEQCHVIDVPEEELDAVISPTGLRIGNSTMAAYYGGLTAHAGILAGLAGASGLLYAYLFFAGLARHQREGRSGRFSRVRCLRAARIGPLIYALSFAYPGSVQIVMGTIFYGSGAWPVFAAAELVLLLLLPLLALWATYKAPGFAYVRPIAGHQLGLSWFLHGSKRWEHRGNGKMHHMFGMFYSDFTVSDMYLFPTELLLNTVIAALQSVRPQTETECDIIGFIVLSLMAGFALYVTTRRSILSPYLLCVTVIALLGEVVAKTLLVVFGAGQKHSHWAVVTAKAIAATLGWVMFVRGLIGFGVLLLDEYRHWEKLPGGGKQHPEGLRPFYFAIHWFLFHGALDAMMGREDQRQGDISEPGSPQTGSPQTVSPQTGSPQTGYRAMGSPRSGPRATFDSLGAEPHGVNTNLTHMATAQHRHACPLRPEPRAASPSSPGTTATGCP